MHERTERRIGRGLIVLGTLLVGTWLLVIADAGMFQARLARRLAALERPTGSERRLARAAATRREARTSGLIGRLDIPRVGLSACVVEGTDGRALRRGVGHVPGTAYPGEPGNVGLAGHRDTFFRKLAGIDTGDRIKMTTPDGVFSYRVDSILIVGPERADLLRRTRAPALTLVTCYPFYFVGPAPRRFVVQAEPDPPLASAGGGTPDFLLVSPRGR